MARAQVCETFAAADVSVKTCLAVTRVFASWSAMDCDHSLAFMIDVLVGVVMDDAFVCMALLEDIAWSLPPAGIAPFWRTCLHWVGKKHIHMLDAVTAKQSCGATAGDDQAHGIAHGRDKTWGEVQCPATVSEHPEYAMIRMRDVPMRPFVQEWRPTVRATQGAEVTTHT